MASMPQFYKYNTYILAFLLLAAMGITAVFSIRQDSFTFDEPAHVVAGYSYLTQQDMRLNPEHPPLIKDLAALPLLFLKLNFPKDHPAWLQKDAPHWWYQFDVGHEFLYKRGNNPDKILFWSRLPMILLTVLFGLFLFFWTKKLFGNATALLSTALFALSPTFLAHGRLVTTDVGSAFGVVLATAFFLNFLKNPSWKNTVLAGFTLGIAQLIKFNLILLYPFFGILLIIWIFIDRSTQKLKTQNSTAQSLSLKTQDSIKITPAKHSNILQNIRILLPKFILILIIVWGIIWLVYFFHIKNLPKEMQLRNAEVLTRTHPFAKFVTPLVKTVSKFELTRPWGYYLLGVAMATERAAGGNTTYFMGQVSAAGWVSYFPIVYILKEPLAFHILTIIALFIAALAIKKPVWQNTWQRLNSWLKSNFETFAMLLWLAIYWASSLSSNLNIGMRHLTPVLPFTYVLVSRTTTEAIKKYSNVLKNIRIINCGYFVVGILLLWQAVSMIKTYPHFIAYFNELAGGPSGGSRYVVDSNVDWGQDLKRLAKWVEQNNIDKIKIAYFGGGDIEYYFGDRAESWPRSEWGTPQKGWLAVSATELRGGQTVPTHRFDQSTDYFYWLLPYKPVAVIGHSIFVYYIPE